ncbi:hypothetical protein BJY04DRAFT_114643 [Aspergillus karnatakaensis]|uniref:Zn(II)2Cys6 transcription factor n=1 Tax=Aspergillus karnatakaensis TaxID=1810916 RepID=UPI003CCE06E1
MILVPPLRGTLRMSLSALTATPSGKTSTRATCTNCRERHLKCDNESEACRTCQKTGEACERTITKIRFRHGSSARYDSLFDKDQVWIRTRRLSNFDIINESCAVIANYHRDLDSDGEAEYDPQTADERRSPSTTANELNDSVTGDDSRHHSSVSSGIDGIAGASHSSTTLQRSHSLTPANCETPQYSGSYGISDETPKSCANQLSTYRVDDSPFSYDYTTIRLEATLLRYFIEELSCWFDVCDPDRNFARVLPHRARNCSSLLHAILTASARHLTTSLRFKTPDGGYRWNGQLIPGLTESTALHYHNHCIRSLLNLSGDASQIQNVDLLAAAIVLRFYEEIDSPLENNTNKGVLLRVLNIFVNAQLPSEEAFPRSILETYHCHQEQRQRLYHHEYLHSSPSGQHGQPAFTQNSTETSTLLRACLSIAFRQELYKSFMTQRPFTLPLSRWSSLRTFAAAGEGTWADRLVLFCADVLEYCYGSSETNCLPSMDIHRWEELSRYADDLQSHLPPYFRPIFQQDPPLHCALNSDGTASDVFPEIWYTDGYVTTSTSHLLLARMLLTVFDPSIPRLGRGHIAGLRRVAETMRETVIRLCGIALHNRRSPSVFVDATIAIEACGEYITDPNERTAVLGVLRITEVEYAWPTGGIAERLRSAWDE